MPLRSRLNNKHQAQEMRYTSSIDELRGLQTRVIVDCTMQPTNTLSLSSIWLVCVAVLTTSTISSATPTDWATQHANCTILVAGGSTASLATALSVAELWNTPNSATLCFIDITDWPGGQLTASAVSAIDFGKLNSPWGHLDNLPLSFQNLVTTGVYGNPGRCWVSEKCYEPADLVEHWILPHLTQHSNIHLFLNTSVVSTTVEDGKIVGATGVQRTPVRSSSRHAGYERNFSDAVRDWYSKDDSAYFAKQTIQFDNIQVAIEATEFGDLMMTTPASALTVAQGIEVPDELSTKYLDTCGQAITMDFFMNLDGNWVTPLYQPWQPPFGCPACPAHASASLCCEYYIERGIVTSWDQVWTYRRSFANGTSSTKPMQGDVSLQNWGAQVRRIGSA